MLVERLNLETNKIEKVEAIGIVQFKGQDKNADLSDGQQYYVIGFHNRLLQIIDDSQDYYYYIPFDAHDIEKKKVLFQAFILFKIILEKLQNFLKVIKKNLLNNKRKMQKNYQVVLYNGN